MARTIRIWLIDDDEDDSFVFETALAALNHPVEFLSYLDSETALSTLLSSTATLPDLIFLDWNMPKLNGKDCLKAIRKLPGFAFLPIIIYTTSRAFQDQTEAKLLGASYFFTKPATISELGEKLKFLITHDWSTRLF